MRKDRNEMVVGIFSIFGFILLTLIVFFVSGVYFFRPGYAVNVMYDFVSILDKGAPVRMAGVRVGEVSEVRLIREANGNTRVRVKLFIEKGVEIRENYIFAVQGTHILSEPHIEITPQASSAKLLQDGSVVEGMPLLPIESLIYRAHGVGEELEALLKALRENVGEKGVKETVQNLNSSAESLSHILKRMERGEGTVGQLLVKDELYQEMREVIAEIKAHPWRLLKKDTGRKKILWVF
ncbi:MAG: MlaD family protein [Candidatus Omnitrophica bacterium]|nr:MlaD family protein [Candidatus Omnitrophota bacterium]